MRRESVRCDQCGEEAVITATEGEFALGDAKQKPRIILIIECPKCGKREQPEERAQQPAK